MTTLLKAVSIINLAARCNKINSCVYIDSNTKKLLDILVNYNLIEYVRLGNNRAYITFKYKNFKPILKSINTNTRDAFEIFRQEVRKGSRTPDVLSPV